MISRISFATWYFLCLTVFLAFLTSLFLHLSLSMSLSKIFPKSSICILIKITLNLMWEKVHLHSFDSYHLRAMHVLCNSWVIFAENLCFSSNRTWTSVFSPKYYTYFVFILNGRVFPLCCLLGYYLCKGELLVFNVLK